ncbi:YSIRK-type signal peptide-containing protein, partial [Streptococcus suis]
MEMSSSTKHSKKRFDWFSRRQRFSIRKYHFGAASVLLGVTLASLATGSLAKADEVQPQEGAVTVEVESAGTAEVIETAVPLEAEKVASALPTETVSPTPEAVESLTPIDITSEASTESTESEETLVLPSLDLSRAATETESPATSDGKIEETVALVPAEETEAKADESIEVAAEEVPEAEPEPEKRKAHLVYSIEYVNADTGKRVSRTPHALYVETTQERAEVDFSMTAQPPAGYRLVDGQANHQVQTLTEETTAVYRFLVVKEEEQTAPQEGTGFRATTNTTQGEDVTVYTGTEHYKNFLNRNKDKLLDQITWIDFSDPTTIFNTGRVRNQAVGGNVMAPSLQVGTVFRKELAPGYVVELEVIELKPFEATEIYHERVKGTDKEQYYNPDRKNHNIKDGTEAHIIAVKQDPTWSHVRQQGLNFGNKAVTLQSDKDGGNVGVKFRGRATYNGNEVPLNFVFMSGEEAKVNEIEIYTTNGEGFELLGELSNSTTTSSYKVNGDADVNWGLDYIKGTNNTMSTPDWRERWNRFLYLNKGTEDVVNSEGEVIQKGSISTAKQVFRDRLTGITYVDGIGTQVFGPVSNRMPSTTTNLSYSTPLIFTRNATEVGMYIASRGRQSAMIGVVVADFGDAPDSYGRPSHTIQITNATKHPYLGTTRGDIDFVPEAIPPGAASWVQDELISSWDEGPNQLMGKNVQKNNNYTLHHSNNGTYSLQFEADPNTNATAYVQGWIDFNNNGKFDKDENSGVLAITNKGTHTLTFSNIKQISDENLHKLGVRLRIAIDRQDILTPDLPAYSGEVEDFQIQLTHPPRSEKVETRNVQGQSQTGTLRFYAFGSETYSDIRATIDTTIAPVMVDADNREVGSDRLDNQGFFYVQGEGKYKVEAVGKDVRVTFVPDPGFITEYADGRKVNQAKGISVRRTATVLDSNGQPYTTGWTAATIDNGLENTSEQISTMDGRYIPHVVAIAPTGTPAISVKMQGEVQTGRPEFVSGSQAVPMGNTVDASGQTLAGDAQPKYPIKLIDKSNQEVESTNAYARVAGVETVVGTYSIDGKTGMVTYTPNDAGKRFVGELLPAEVIARDANGAEARTTYTPSIMPVLPIAEPATTVGLQGKTQSGRVHFAKSPTAPSGVADLIGSSLTLLNEQNAPVTELVIAGQGTYRLESDGSITFVPLATFIGPATAVKVQMTDSNGSLATTTYTAIVVEARPVGRPQATYGLKGDVQTSSPDFFTPGQVDLDGDRNYDPVKEVVDLNKASLTLVDAGGQDVRTVRVENQGEYRLMDDGTITFTPDQNFVGQANPVTVKIADVNGTSATTLYTPTVIEVPEDQLTETVTRTIRYVYANGSQAFEPSEKTLHFTRTATANPLTGDISYSEWTSTDADFPAVTSPSLTNYTASLQEVLQETGVAATADDQSITVIYRENEKQLATITFKTESGTELAKDSQTGHSGSPISYDPSARIADLEQRGYVLVRNDFAAESDKTFDNQLDRDQNWDIVFKEKVVESVPDRPQNPGDPVDPNNPAGPRWEAVVKTVTRTVSYKYDSQDGREAAPTQETSVTFKRTGSYNFVSKQVTYTDWVADQADTVLEGRALPVLAGYTATSAFENGQAVLVASTTQDRTVTSLSENITELVVYTADTQQASISYKLENGPVLAPTDTVTGPSASPISYDTSARIAELVQKGYVLVRDGFTDVPSPVFDLDSLQHQSFEVIFKEQIITIRPNEPKEPNTPVSTDPNGPQYPDGLKESDLKDTVVRVIRYLYEDGTEAGDPVREELVFTRTATLNVVTKAIQYGPWESVDNQFDLVPTPEKAGYTPDQAEVAAQENVQALSPDSEIRIVYRKNRQLGSIRFVDVTKPDAPVQLNQVPLVGKTAEPFAYDTSALEAAYSSMGYQVTNRDGYSKDGVFDTIADNSQDFVFELVQRTSSSTPDNPQTPGTPVDASNPNGPKWEAVTSEISRTVSYHLDTVDGQVAPGTTSATTSVRYERTGIYNHVTKQVIYTPWVAENADTTLEGRTLPVVTGYVATEASRNDQAIAPKDTEQAIDILPLAANIVERVVYKSLSEWRITPPPGKDPVPPIAYPNHPMDPTKPADPTPAPGIPVHEGFIPVGPDGQDLPKDPVTNLYLPPVPTDPTQPTDIRYRALEQTAVVRYVLDGTEQDLVPAVRLTGDSEARIEHSAQATIAQLENEGYTLVTDGYSLDTGRFYDTDSNQDQEFRVSFKETVVTIVPTDPKNPGDPVDPSKPNGPSYPDGLTASDLKESVTRTIHYVYADSSQAAPSHSETLYYTRKAQVNLVTKVVTYEAWTSLDDQFKAVDSPVIRNFTPDQVRVAEKTSVDALAPDEVITVIYRENGKQLATITYRLEAGTTTVEVAKDSLEGHPEQDIAYTTTDRIRAFEQLGYELVSDAFTAASPQERLFDSVENNIQNFDVILRAKLTTIQPNDPHEPGKPVDPNNPTSPVLEDLTETVTRRVKFTDQQGTELVASPTPTTAQFIRTATYNHVSKVVTYSDWIAVDAVVEGSPIPVVKGYIATTATANGEEVHLGSIAKDKSVKYNSEDIDEVVIYSPLGSWTPRVPDGFDPIPPVVYPNHPTDPTVPGTDRPIIPF